MHADDDKELQVKFSCLEKGIDTHSIVARAIQFSGLGHDRIGLCFNVLDRTSSKESQSLRQKITLHIKFFN